MTHPIHLCQPGGAASCGACCGLYNHLDHSQPVLWAELQRRTREVRGTPTTLHAYREVAARLARPLEEPLFAQVRVCPLLGFIDADFQRVGCLAHPLVTGGPDLRDCGAYHAQLCADFECPSFDWLTEAEAKLVQRACADWFTYGLVITDVDFLREVFRRLSERAGTTVGAEHLLPRPAAVELFGRLCALKERVAPPVRALGRFEPDALGDGVLSTLDYQALGVDAAPEDELILALGCRPATPPPLFALRNQVRSLLDAIDFALRRNA